MDCFACILDNIRAADTNQHPLPVIADADTMHQGNALCRRHVEIIVRQQAAQQSRRPLLVAQKQ